MTAPYAYLNLFEICAKSASDKSNDFDTKLMSAPFCSSFFALRIVASLAHLSFRFQSFFPVSLSYQIPLS